MKVRQYDRQDLNFLVAIQEKNPLAPQWPAGNYERLADDPGGMILVAELETMEPVKVLGFAAFRRVIDEAELLTLAVAPEHQRQGVGRALLEEAHRRLLEAGAKRVFLEVRQSNRAALKLYYGAGFGLHSQRKDYYRDPPEDAYILALELFPPVSVPEFAR
jgi:[ribosomal protein S18]-alanine N-acetyltransferase